MTRGRRLTGSVAAFALPAILLPAAILAVLGYVSLRQWETAADLLFREQSTAMAAMAAEKVRTVLTQAEDEAVQRIQSTVERHGVSPDALHESLARSPVVTRLYLLDQRGRVRFPPDWTAAEADVIAAVERVALRSVRDRPGRQYLRVGAQTVVATAIAGGGADWLLAGIVRDPDVVRRDVLERTLGSVEGTAFLAVVDAEGRPVYARQSLAGAERIVAVPLGEELPAWHLALYQPAGLSPRDAVRRQTALFSLALGLLLVVIVAGLVATFRLVRRETQMAQLKADFVANVSHDLKTPLSLIRMFGETLELGRVTDEGRRAEYYRVITRESERLSRLIDNVLDFSRIDRGRRRYDIVPTAIEPIVRDATDAFAHVLAQQGLAVETTVAPDLPDVPMDADAIGQALANLIDNAVKFSDAGKSIRIDVRLRGEHLTVTVTDDGIGIPRVEQARIFDKFYRVGRGDTQGRRGSGVGLALVRHIMEAHGGRVTVDSEPGRGSRFTLWLPRTGSR